MVGIGSTPNSELFRASLDISSDGGIITDSSLRTSHASGDVFAAGDVACVPISLGREVDENLSPIIMRSEHVGSAQSMGTHAAGVMLGSAHANTPYNPVPFMYSRLVVHLFGGTDSNKLREECLRSRREIQTTIKQACLASIDFGRSYRQETSHSRSLMP